MKKLLLLVASHGLAGAVGFAVGIYTLPILIAPSAPTAEEVMADVGEPKYKGEFRRDLKGSDFLHWGEGTVYVSGTAISFIGQLAPGPDYKLYLSPEFVETEAQFEQLKAKMVRVGDVATFDNFSVPVPESVNPGEFNSVVVWCESFGEFITSARYK